MTMMETRENLELRLKQVEGALASAVADLQGAEAVIDHLRNALRPFADLCWEYHHFGDYADHVPASEFTTGITIGRLRAAHNALYASRP